MCEHCSQNFLEKEKALKDEIYEVVRYLFSTVRVNVAYNDNLRVGMIFLTFCKFLIQKKIGQ